MGEGGWGSGLGATPPQGVGLDFTQRSEAAALSKPRPASQKSLTRPFLSFCHLQKARRSMENSCPFQPRVGQSPWGLVRVSALRGSWSGHPSASSSNRARTAAPLPPVVIPPQASPLLLNKTEGATGGFLEDGLHVNPVSPD